MRRPMKKYAEILKDIAAARAGMVDTAKTEKDLTRKAMLVARVSGTDAELNAAEAALANAVSAYNKLTRGRIAQASTRGGVNRRFII